MRLQEAYSLTDAARSWCSSACLEPLKRPSWYSAMEPQLHLKSSCIHMNSRDCRSLVLSACHTPH